jgi:hypothetical protein
MNTDFRLSVGLFAHPKFVKLKRRLGDPGALAYIALLAFVAQHRSDGSLTGMDAEDVAIAAGYGGVARDLVAALVEVRFVDGAGTGEDPYRVHDWLEHNPWAAGAKARSERARDAANHRWGGGERGPEAEQRSPDAAAACSPDAGRMGAHADGAGAHAAGMAADANGIGTHACGIAAHACGTGAHAGGIASCAAGQCPSPLLSLPSPSPSPSPSWGEVRTGTLFLSSAADDGGGRLPSGDAIPAERRAPPPDRSTRMRNTGTRIPADFAPSAEMLGKARLAFPDVDLAEQTERFRDHWAAKAGVDALKCDWAAAWRTWIRFAQDERFVRRRPVATVYGELSADPHLAPPSPASPTRYREFKRQ